MAGGGAEKVLLTLLKHIDRKKFDVTLCCIVDTGIQRDQIPQHINYTYIIPDPNSCTSGMKRILYKIKYKLVYDWLPPGLIYRLWIPKNHDTEIAWVEGFATKLMSHSTSLAHKVAWVHCDLLNNHWISKIFRNRSEERNCYKTFKSIIGVSQTATDAIHKLYGNAISAMTLYNPVDCDEIISLSKIPVTLPPKRDNALRICSSGRFVPVKAFDRLLRITNRLAKEGCDVELWLLGDGELRNQYEQYIADNDLKSTVTLWGFKQNPYPYIADCDIFVCSSISEGYSTAATEALILGKPVVTTDCSGMRELLRNDCGIITDNDEISLYDGIKKVFENPELRQRYALNAVNRGKEFHVNSLIHSIETVLYGISSNSNI